MGKVIKKLVEVGWLVNWAIKVKHCWELTAVIVWRTEGGRGVIKKVIKKSRRTERNYFFIKNVLYNKLLLISISNRRNKNKKFLI